MDLTTCKLYRIQRKRDLAVLLKIENIKKIGQISKRERKTNIKLFFLILYNLLLHIFITPNK